MQSAMVPTKIGTEHRLVMFGKCKMFAQLEELVGYLLPVI